MRRVLVLRPEPGATATVEKAQAVGLKAVAVPLFTIEPVQWETPDAGSFDGVLLTSANAVTFGGEALHSLRGLKVYAVGEATAQAAREAGFDIAARGDAGVDRLLSSIEPNLKLLHLCGADRRDAADAKQQITRVIVYRAVPIDAPDLSEAAGNIALIHSPRAGRRFAELIGGRATISIAAISEAAADAAGDGWRTIETTAQPTDEALLALAATLCNKPDPE
jgi:uroporphyrinogen-III synthase